MRAPRRGVTREPRLGCSPRPGASLPWRVALGLSRRRSRVRAPSSSLPEDRGDFVSLPGGKLGFETDSSSLAHAIRRIRSEAIAEAARLKSKGEPTRGLELIRDEGDNRFVFYRLRHTWFSDGLMGGIKGASIAKVGGTSSRMVDQVYGHLLDDHQRETATAVARARRRRG